jgi:hypothetical protein
MGVIYFDLEVIAFSGYFSYFRADDLVKLTIKVSFYWPLCNVVIMFTYLVYDPFSEFLGSRFLDAQTRQSQSKVAMLQIRRSV